MLPGMTTGQYNHLKGLVNKAARAQELEHNERNAPDSTPTLNAVEKYAKEFGYVTNWPGIYPNFINSKDGRTHYLD